MKWFRQEGFQEGKGLFIFTRVTTCTGKARGKICMENSWPAAPAVNMSHSPFSKAFCMCIQSVCVYPGFKGPIIYLCCCVEFMGKQFCKMGSSGNVNLRVAALYIHSTLCPSCAAAVCISLATSQFRITVGLFTR